MMEMEQEAVSDIPIGNEVRAALVGNFLSHELESSRNSEMDKKKQNKKDPSFFPFSSSSSSTIKLA